MALKINTNIAALTAHRNMLRTDSGLSGSLERLASGLRINKAADDASGMAIADNLKAQALGLGQAVKNANDGISIVQTADGALDEAIKITNTIKTKAIQAAQDGQTFDSRKKIQADIDKLLQELDIIAKTTSFNGKKLLSGEFANKSFQVGAYSGETVNVSIQSAEITKLGHVTTSTMTVENTGEMALKITSSVKNQTYELQAVDLQYNNSLENGIGALAGVINKLSDELGITAQAVVESGSAGAVQAGTISGLIINGVEIGDIAVAAADSDGALAVAINGKSDQTGVAASVDSNGILTLSAADGRAIKVEGDTAGVLGKNAGSLTTFGEIRLTQMGANELLIQDAGSGLPVGADFVVKGDSNTVLDDMTLAAGSILATGTKLAAGSTLGADLTMASQVASFTTTIDSTIKAGSTLAGGTVIEAGTTIGGTFNVASTAAITGDSLVKAGSTLASNTVLKAGTTVTSDIDTSVGIISAGTTLSQDVTTTGTNLLDADMIMVKDSNVGTGTILAAGSSLQADLTMASAGQVTTDFTLLKGSTVANSGTTLAAGTVLGGDVTLGSTTLTATQGMTLTAGSTMISGSTIAKSSTLGFNLTVNADKQLDTAMVLKAGTQLAADSILKKGTYLTNDVVTTGGTTIQAGTTLEQDATIAATTLTNDMVVAKESTIKADSVIAANGGGGLAGAELTDATVHRLFELDVTTQESAQIAISIADSTLASYDNIRANLGSVQNQLTSTIANIQVTQTNVLSAESAIRDVDFAEESATFAKFQVLAQSGSFAMAQANASLQNVLRLLQ
ncbi:MAG: flagellar protein FlaB [Deltaproteobacteria bacterium]|nr:flagellar protein FlaB [Candidatus Anaeroferrophillacea bacterium]